MTTFDPTEVRAFADDLDARMTTCDNGEGMQCSNMDATLQRYAELCCEFTERCREWGRGVFSGQVAFDPKVDEIWHRKGIQLFERALAIWQRGQDLRGKCFEREGGAPLGSALFCLMRLLTPWVAPKRAMSPLSRNGLAMTPQDKQEFQSRVDALAPLPKDWQPEHVEQQTLWRKLRQALQG